jgi:hypothetical protein
MLEWKEINNWTNDGMLIEKMKNIDQGLLMLITFKKINCQSIHTFSPI